MKRIAYLLAGAFLLSLYFSTAVIAQTPDLHPYLRESGSTAQFCVDGYTSPAAIPADTATFIIGFSSSYHVDGGKEIIFEGNVNQNGTIVKQQATFSNAIQVNSPLIQQPYSGSGTYTACADVPLNEIQKHDEYYAALLFEYNACITENPQSECQLIFNERNGGPTIVAFSSASKNSPYETPYISYYYTNTGNGELYISSNHSAGVTTGRRSLDNLKNVIDPSPTIAPNPGGGKTTMGGSTGPDFCADGTSLATAIGCIPTGNYPELFGKILGFGIGIAGGIAFLMILIGGLKVLMSTGNPEKLEEGKDQIQSALVGLILIIFSVFILQLIGVQMLRIPGFH